MRRKYLEDYEQDIGEITGINRDVFDNASKYQVLDVQCDCGEEFKSSRRDLIARFNRRNKIKCRSCVNKMNITARYDVKS